MDVEVGTKFYRFCDNDIAERPPILQTLYACKLTPQGCWIVHRWCWPMPQPLITAIELKHCGARLVIHSAGRKYGYPTVELAMRSYVIRKERQIQHAENAMQSARNALDWCKRAKYTTEMVEFDEPEPISSMSFPPSLQTRPF